MNFKNKSLACGLYCIQNAWLGIEGVVQPFEDDEECDVEAIRQLLDEDEEQSS